MTEGVCHVRGWLRRLVDTCTGAHWRERSDEGQRAAVKQLMESAGSCWRTSAWTIRGGGAQRRVSQRRGRPGRKRDGALVEAGEWAVSRLQRAWLKL